MSPEEMLFNAMKAKGHMPIMDKNGELDVFVHESGDHHNGPGCEAYRWNNCWHCITVEEIPECEALTHDQTS